MSRPSRFDDAEPAACVREGRHRSTDWVNRHADVAGFPGPSQTWMVQWFAGWLGTTLAGGVFGAGLGMVLDPGAEAFIGGSVASHHGCGGVDNRVVVSLSSGVRVGDSSAAGGRRTGQGPVFCHQAWRYNWDRLPAPAFRLPGNDSW